MSVARRSRKVEMRLVGLGDDEVEVELGVGLEVEVSATLP